MSLFKKLFKKQKAETRVIDGGKCELVKLNEIESNQLIANRLKLDVESGKIKNYKGVQEFIKSTSNDVPMNFSNDLKIYAITITGEIKLLAKNWMTRWYKCDDKDLDEFISSISKV